MDMTSASKAVGQAEPDRFWDFLRLSNFKVSHEWSDALEWMIDAVLSGEAEIIGRSEHYLRIGDSLPIWIANYPYAYGKVGDSGPLPRMGTRRRLARLVAAYDVLKATSSPHSKQPDNEGNTYD